MTVSPDDINNPTSFRLCQRSCNNSSFPSDSPAEFYKAMEEDSTILAVGDVQVPINYSARAKAAASNPVATVLEYEALVENLLTVLIGIKPSSQQWNGTKTVRTWYFKDPESKTHRKGVFGFPTAFFAVHETQQRGALHLHMVIWGGLSGKLLECAAEFPDLCEAISQVLNSMYTAEIPRGNHIKDFLQKEMKKKFAPSTDNHPNPAILISPSVSHFPAAWKKHACDNCLKTNIHTHSHTCKKHPAGFHACRMAKPNDL